MKKKRIFNKSVALKLIGMGCTLVDLERNKFNPNFQVFVFHDTPSFREVLSKVA